MPPIGDALVIDMPLHINNKRNNIMRGVSQVTQGSPGQMQFRPTSGNWSKYLTEKLLETRDLAKHVIACPSDKLAVCNIAGVQGALLSQFLQPVYLQKFIF